MRCVEIARQELTVPRSAGEQPGFRPGLFCSNARVLGTTGTSLARKYYVFSLFLGTICKDLQMRAICVRLSKRLDFQGFSTIPERRLGCKRSAVQIRSARLFFKISPSARTSKGFLIAK
jgi:hypothetical protein